MYNRVILVGRLVADPQVRYTSEGKPVCNFTLAVDRPSPTGETDFLDIVAFDKLADIIQKYLSKGRLVLVEGRLRTRLRERPDGTRQKVYEIYARDLRMLDSRKKREELEEAPSRKLPSKPTGTPKSANDFAEPESDEFDFGVDDITDLPF
jgi:single-strand DNA-binding protein